MLIENLPREDLTADEEARADQGLIGQGYNQVAIAQRLRVSASRISRNLRLYSREALATAVASGTLGKGEAQKCLRLTPALQEHAVERVTTTVARQITRQAEQLLDAGDNPQRTIDVATRHFIDRGQARRPMTPARTAAIMDSGDSGGTILVVRR